MEKRITVIAHEATRKLSCTRIVQIKWHCSCALACMYSHVHAQPLMVMYNLVTITMVIESCAVHVDYMCRFSCKVILPVSNGKCTAYQNKTKQWTQKARSTCDRMRLQSMSQMSHSRRLQDKEKKKETGEEEEDREVEEDEEDDGEQDQDEDKEQEEEQDEEEEEEEQSPKEEEEEEEEDDRETH